MGVLKFTSNKATLEVKRRLVNGIIMSRLIYGIPIWGISATSSVLGQIQQVQNISMRWILGANRYTSIRSLLNQCNFISVHQSVIYFSILQYWKLLKFGVSRSLVEWVDHNSESPVQTLISGNVWSRVAPAMFERLPLSIRQEQKVSVFKRRSTLWIKNNIPIMKPGWRTSLLITVVGISYTVILANLHAFIHSSCSIQIATCYFNL